MFTCSEFLIYVPELLKTIRTILIRALDLLSVNYVTLNNNHIGRLILIIKYIKCTELMSASVEDSAKTHYKGKLIYG
jgi:hypothetical protein